MSTEDLAKPGPPARRPGRPRTISDDDIFAAAIGVLAQQGSRGLTLARLATVLGVTPAAIRQRLGSKRGLLLELARRRAGHVEEGFAAAMSSHRSPIEALQAALLARLEGLDEPVRLANAISAYVDNAADSELRGLFDAELTAMERCVGEVLTVAVEAGEIAGPVTPELTSTVFAAFEGTLTIWAIAPRGTLEDRVRQAIELTVGRSPTRRVPEAH